MSIESFSINPLSTIIPSYLYQQYADDQDLQAFIASYNSIAQGYIDWFNNTPLAVYTSSFISGTLLDWTAEGLYGISRPTLSSSQITSYGDMNSTAMNSLAMNAFFYQSSGTAQIADDDIYKRVLTWILYRGDGKQGTIQWLRRRIARFIYGANGSDVSVDYLHNISIQRSAFPLSGGYTTSFYTDLAYTGIYQQPGTQESAVQIKVPTNAASQAMALLISAGLLPLPFQLIYQVTLV